MSDRSIFSYRYTVPGFIFVLSIFSLNLEIIAYYFRQNIQVSTVLSIASFLTSPALGFLTTQGWYLFFRRILPNIHTEWRKSLFNKGIVEENTVTICDYWVYEESNISKNLDNYLTRRLDFFHTLGATSFTILISILAGFTVKFVLIYFDNSINILTSNYGLYLGFVTVILFLLMYLFWIAANDVKKEQDDMLVRIVQKWMKKN